MLLLLESVAINQTNNNVFGIQEQTTMSSPTPTYSVPRANNYAIANNKYPIITLSRRLEQQDNQLEALQDLGHGFRITLSSLLGHSHSDKAHFPVSLCPNIGKIVK